MAALHAHNAKTLETIGIVSGSDLHGSFHSWQTGTNERFDESIGARTQSTFRLGDRQFIVSDSGDVREVRGLLLERQKTQDFIENGGFVSQPQYDSYGGLVDLPDGRAVYAITVAPPGGQKETVDLDTKTYMIDRISFDDNDGIETQDYYDYGVFGGIVLAQRIVDSNGDHLYDVTHFTEHVAIDRPIPEVVFTIPPSTVVQTDKPVTVPLSEHDGHYYTQVQIHGHEYTFLIDTGAQAIVLDARVAQRLNLKPEGHLEVAGATRTGGLGLASLDALQIGGATLPVRVVSILDLGSVAGLGHADGVLGFPFFASAEVALDPAALKMTFAKPGKLHTSGAAIPIDVDRQLIELQGTVNSVDGRFVIDTGNSTELLLFAPFMSAHPSMIPPGARHFSNSYGVGGGIEAVSATIDQLDMGQFHFYNRYADIVLSKQGAFADRFDAGNIGMGVLKNLVVTFDVANAKMYADRGRAFDDGRFRTRTEGIGIPRK